MSIPVIAGPLGYDSWYVKVFRNIGEIVGNPKKFVLEWIASNRKLIVHTDRLDDATSYRITSMLDYTVPAGIEVVRYNHHIEISWRDINKYAECVTYNDLLAVNPNYKNDLTSDGGWIYPMPKFNSEQTNLFMNSNVVYMDFVGNYVNGSTFLTSSYKLKKLKFKANTVSWFSYFTAGCDKLEEVEIDCPVCRYAGYQWFYGCRSLREIRFVQKMQVWGTGRDFSFSGAILSKASVLNLFEQVSFAIPNTITLGIHIDYENDPEIMAAIEAGRAEGLTINVKWNGTRTT